MLVVGLHVFLVSSAPTCVHMVPQCNLALFHNELTSEVDLYAPATGQFCTQPFLLPASGLTLNVDARWAGQLPRHSRSVRRAARALLELRVRRTPGGWGGLARFRCVATSAWRALSGREVQLRITFRDAIIHSLGR
jgi:hypothetical protein